MKQTVNFSNFCAAFRSMDRNENFSYEGKRVLFDYLEEVDSDYELDVIALCCDYTESTLEEINRSYNQEFESLEEAREWLQDGTSVVGLTDNVENSIVYANF